MVDPEQRIPAVEAAWNYDGSISNLPIVECIIMSSIVGGAVGLRLLTKRMPTAYYFFIIILSYCIALGVRKFDFNAHRFDQASDTMPMTAVQICAPVFLFYSSMGTDFSELSFNTGITVLYLLVFGILSTIATTLVVWPILNFSCGMTFVSTMLVMCILSPRWATNAVNELNQVQGHIRDTQILLKFEEFCTIWFAMVLTELLIKWIALSSWVMYSRYRAAMLTLYQSVGFFIGAGFGLIIRIPMGFAYNDIAAQAVIILSSLYIVQLSCSILGTNKGLAVGIFSVLLNSNKVKMSKEAEEFHGEAWHWLLFIAKTTIAMLASFILGMKRPNSIGLSHYGIIFVMYCILFSFRLLAITLSQAWFATLPPGEMYWKRVIILAMGPYNGMPCLLLGLTYCSWDEELGYLSLTYVLGVVVLSLFFNSFLFSPVLRILGMFEYKRATIVNMNIAVNQVIVCRDRAIYSQKADLVISDANWSIVEKMTRLPHPYRRSLMETGYSDDRGDFRLRTVICPTCGIEVVAPPTKAEIEDMIVEAKQRVLKIQLVSFTQQYENGTLSRHSFRTLFSVIDTAANSGVPVIDSTPLKIQTQESKVTRFFLRVFSYLTLVTDKIYYYIPENLCRQFAFHLSTSRPFNIIMAFLALADTAIILQLLAVWWLADRTKGYPEFTDANLEFGRIAEVLDILFFILFTLEMTIHLLGLGFQQYAASTINKIEAGTLLLRATGLLMFLRENSSRGGFISVLLASDVVMGLKLALLIRAVRVYIFIIGWLPKCLSLIEKQAEAELMRNYEVGKGYLISLDRVMKFLNHVAVYESVYTAVRTEIESERKKVAKDLGLIQKEHPSIAITVKTRHAIRYVINSVGDCINDLKEDGILDLNECKAINDSLEKCKDDLRELPMVDPSLAQGVLKDIPWLGGYNAEGDAFVENAVLTSYDYNDRIISVGDDPVGLYILVSGLIKAYYTPTPKTTQLNSKFGVLPNYDFFEVVKFDQQQDSYVVSGNVIGEIGAVSGRRYDMSVLCETSVQLYYIPWNIIKSVVHESPEAEYIQNNIWKCIGIRLAVILLQSKSHFADWSKEKMLMYLDGGFVPSLSLIKCINVNEDIGDLILIEGVCRDDATKKIFVAPAHLPRGIKLLQLPEHPGWNFETVYPTRLLIVPLYFDRQIPMNVLFTEHMRIVEALIAEGKNKVKRVGFDNHDYEIGDSEEPAVM